MSERSERIMNTGQPVKASIAVAAVLRTRIVTGLLSPGDALPVEDELTTAFGCSKPVVREALRILETEGLVEVKRGLGGGPRVCHPSVGHTASAMGVHLQIGDVPVFDVWIALDRIVAGAVERVAAAAGAVDLAPLEVEIGALVDSIGDLLGFNQHLLDVEETAVRLAGNATEHLLVGALRHIVDGEVTAATARVSAAEDLDDVRREQHTIAAAWQRTFAHLRAGEAAAARSEYEKQAARLRSLVASGLEDVPVGATRRQ